MDVAELVKRVGPRGEGVGLCGAFAVCPSVGECLVEVSEGGAD